MPRQLILPNAENCSLSELDSAISCTPTQKIAFRLMAIKTLIMGFDYHKVTILYNICSRTLARWVKQFNESGIDGLIDKSKSGRPNKISDDLTKQLLKVIDKPQQANENHWTGKKFHGYLKQNFIDNISYTTVIRWLHKNKYCLKVPRPWPDKQDEIKRKKHVKQINEYLSNDEIELWYADETGVDGDPRPRQRWALKGSKQKISRNGTHLRMSATGMVCPRTGEFFAIEFDRSNTQTFQIFLDNANKAVSLSRKRNILIVDNASWHKSKTLDWGNFEVCYLPPYSPDLNPIERLWLSLKLEWFSDFIAHTMDELIDRFSIALCWLINRKNKNIKTCKIKTKL